MSSYVPSRKFCCCLPVRLGALILTCLDLVVGAAVAIVLWVSISRLNELNLSHDGRIAIYVMAVVWSLTAAFSLFGFLGVIFKWRRCVTAFSAMTWLQVLASLGTGSYFIYTLFHNNDGNKCANDNASDLEHKACQTVSTASRIVVIVLYIVIWIIMIWAGSIVSEYVGQLREEESAVSEYESREHGPQQQAPIFVVPQMPTTYAPYTLDPASKGDKPNYAL